ncbi:MAG: hypothetical protein D6775_14230 [Caldilineae bacterium]|nr:MAG: hypothetical protein D6775_14230 [Caldilineae bacterium]
MLRRVSEGEPEWPDPPERGEGKNLREAKAAYPDLFAILDGTEQPVQLEKSAVQGRASALHGAGRRFSGCSLV